MTLAMIRLSFNDNQKMQVLVNVISRRTFFDRIAGSIKMKPFQALKLKQKKTKRKITIIPKGINKNLGLIDTGVAKIKDAKSAKSASPLQGAPTETQDIEPNETV